MSRTVGKMMNGLTSLLVKSLKRHPRIQSQLEGVYEGGGRGSSFGRTNGHPGYTSSKHRQEMWRIVLVRNWICSLSRWRLRAGAQSRND